MWLMVVLTAAITSIITVYIASHYAKKKLCDAMEDTWIGREVKGVMEKMAPTMKIC